MRGLQLKLCATPRIPLGGAIAPCHTFLEKIFLRATFASFILHRLEVTIASKMTTLKWRYNNTTMQLEGHSVECIYLR